MAADVLEDLERAAARLADGRNHEVAAWLLREGRAFGAVCPHGAALARSNRFAKRQARLLRQAGAADARRAARDELRRLRLELAKHEPCRVCPMCVSFKHNFNGGVRPGKRIPRPFCVRPHTRSPS